MGELGRRLDLAVEPLHGLGRFHGRGRQHLDGHQAVHAPVLGLVDHAHPAFAQLPNSRYSSNSRASDPASRKGTKGSRGRRCNRAPPAGELLSFGSSATLSRGEVLAACPSPCRSSPGGRPRSSRTPGTAGRATATSSNDSSVSWPRAKARNRLGVWAVGGHDRVLGAAEVVPKRSQASCERRLRL